MALNFLKGEITMGKLQTKLCEWCREDVPSRSYYQGSNIVDLIRQIASAHAEASLALHRCPKREAKLKASSK
jgi:hypothetical protein